MTTPITRVILTPNYAAGFTYAWEVTGALSDPAPWTFTVEQAAAPAGAWTPISPTLVGTYRWSEIQSRHVNKNDVLYFHVKMVTPKGTYYSEVITPYGDLGRREFLIAKDIMRREVLHARTLAGVQGQLWLVSTFGPRCPLCVDPITGQIRDTACKSCFGTGRVPPYNGPYETWWTVSPTKRTTQMAEDGTGTREPKSFEIRMIGTPPSKKNDLVVDTNTDKRYYVDTVQVVTELRRIPVVQILTVHEAPVSDSAYKVGR